MVKRVDSRGKCGLWNTSCDPSVMGGEVLIESMMEDILSKENLREALKTVKRNRGGPGVDGMTVDDIDEHLKQHWPMIRGKLLAGTYQPGLIKGVRLRKPNGGERLLGIPNVLDRLIQQGIHQQLSRIFEPEFSDSSYGFRPDRSAHDAIYAAQALVKSGKDWVVDIDISAFFDQVNHDILMTRIGQVIRDKRLLQLIGRYLRTGMLLDGEVRKRKEGTPQGGPLSPLLANIYLDALDKELERRGLSFVRYADDLTIYVRSERSAERVYASIRDWIKRHLRLEVNEDKSGTGRPWQGKFLGFTLDRSGEVRISKSSVESYKAKVRQLWDARQSLSSADLVRNWGRFIRGWWQYYGIAGNLLVAESKWTRRHMRKCFWLRWHSKAGRRRHMARLGVNTRTLARVNYYASAWPAATHPALQWALSRRTLQRYGLLTPHDLAVA